VKEPKPPKSYTIDEFDDNELILEAALRSPYRAFRINWMRNENVPEWHDATLHLTLTERSLLTELTDFWAQLVLLASEDPEPEEVIALLERQGFTRMPSWVKHQGIEPGE
jgi:hypothetical protein